MWMKVIPKDDTNEGKSEHVEEIYLKRKLEGILEKEAAERNL